MALLFDLLIALLYLICALIACAVVAGRVNIVGGAGTGSDSPVRDSLMLYSSVRLSLFWDDAELQQLEKKAANNYFWDVTVETDDDGGKGGRKERPRVRFALSRLAMTLLLGTAAFALVGTVVNFYALPKCYGRPLEMNGDESETEITNLAGAASLFSKCTTECLEELFELGKDEANTGEGEVHHGKPTLGKVSLVGDLSSTVDICASSFEATGPCRSPLLRSVFLAIPSGHSPSLLFGLSDAVIPSCRQMG